ncbi:MAG: GIY-YIG nuclease family protein [Melioribacteraceae bacterium]|nr:GIY-YIG nuclease family protein [Melioribacteraceae bacterium]
MDLYGKQLRICLISSKDKKRYIGLTNNLERRIKEHNCGKVKSTKHRVPFELVYFENFESRNEAALREKFFKSGKGREFLKKIRK